jgi:hypothetical protein
MRDKTFKQYLGDSVYAKFDGYHIVLTTENGYPDDPRNTIALEPDVFDALNRYVDFLKRELSASNA